MAKFKITSKTTVADLKEQFGNEVGCVLRVYQGRSEAPDGATLVSLGAKEGELECRTSRTVGKFEEAFQNEFNLKVKVYTKDNWVKVLDGITLATAGQLPNGMTKAKMEEHLSYQRDGEEPAEVVNEKAAENVEVPNIFKGIPLVDLSFTKLTMSDKEIEENSDELDVPGVVVIYAYDEDDDFIASAWCDSSIYDLLVDNCREWTNEYEGERRFEYFISKQVDTYGFSESLDKDDLYEIVGCAISQYVGDYDSIYSDLGSKILIRARWDDKTDIFSINNSGNYDNAWSLEEKFPELIRLTLAGKNVREFPAIPLYKGAFVEIDVDDILTADMKEFALRIKENSDGGKYAGAIFFKCYFTNDSKLQICVKEKNVETAFQNLKNAVKAVNAEIDWCDFATVLIDYEGYEPDGNILDCDDAFEMVTQLKMREMRFDELPTWNGSACFFYSVGLRRGRTYPKLCQFDANGKEIELVVEKEEVEQKFELDVEE